MSDESDDAPLPEPLDLLRAYAQGIFPMGDDDPSHPDALTWCDPRRRGILPLDNFHVPRRFARTLRREPFRVDVDRDFAAVMNGCAARPRTWITPPLLTLYRRLHEGGAAHSIECRRDEDDDVLAGGLYGVALGGAFFAESMFSTVADASKTALVHLAARLRLGGFRLLDAQFMTPHLRRFGGVEIPRREYRRRLGVALRTRGNFFALRDSSSRRALEILSS